MDPLMLAGIGLATVAAFFAGKLLIKGDNRIETRRRCSAEIAAELKAEGLSELAKIFLDHSVGDYSAMWRRGASWVEEMSDPARRRALWDRCLQTQLDRAMADPARREVVVAAVDRYRAVEAAEQEALRVKFRQAELAAAAEAATQPRRE